MRSQNQYLHTFPPTVMLGQMSVAKLVAFAITGAAFVAGQTSPVTTCIDSYKWSINSLGQTPCLVAAYLESACGPPVISIPALPAGNSYLGPTAATQNPCVCSSVTYSMISACAGCQGRNFQNWTTWTTNCLSAPLTTFPKPIPAIITVPNWALLNVSQSNDKFDPVLAQNTLSTIGLSPPIVSSTSASPPTTSSEPPTPTSAADSGTPTPPHTQAASTSKHTNGGAIAGGVVGGLVFLAIVVLGVLWWQMRKRKNAAPTNASFDNRALVAPSTVMSQPTGISSFSPDGPSTGPYSSPLYYGTSTDMSTIPTSPVTSGVYTTLTGTRRSLESVSHSLAHFGGLQPTHTSPARQPTGYNGAAEV